MTIDNREDIIDSRVIMERIEELRTITFDRPRTEEEDAEMASLNALWKEAADYSPDWEYGVPLVRDTYFTEYARQLAEDVGMLDTHAATTWPTSCIDWEHAARELKHDYTAVDYGGVTYWVQS